MDIVFFVVMALMSLTLVALVLGVVFMGGGGKMNAKLSNRLMVARVVFQGGAIAAITLLVYLTGR